MLNGTNGYHPPAPAPPTAIPSRLEKTIAALETALDEVIEGVMDPPVARAVADLARTIAEIVRSADIDARVKALEQEAGHVRR